MGDDGVFLSGGCSFADSVAVFYGIGVLDGLFFCGIVDGGGAVPSGGFSLAGRVAVVSEFVTCSSFVLSVGVLSLCCCCKSGRIDFFFFF